MTSLAIIGGSGLDEIPDLDITHQEIITTPFGEASAALIYGSIADHEIVFLPRHGATHNIPPHRVNYRANLWALQHAGIETIVGVAAVGGISDEMSPGRIVIPDQIIDYTYGREQTYFADESTQVTHIDFTYPYCDELRQALIKAGEQITVQMVTTGTYAATQGPRLETAMEVRRLANDGCDIVGMTGMPEAALARELDICYASCAVVVNWAAGKHGQIIKLSEIERNLSTGMVQVRDLLTKFLTMQTD